MITKPYRLLSDAIILTAIGNKIVEAHQVLLFHIFSVKEKIKQDIIKDVPNLVSKHPLA